MAEKVRFSAIVAAVQELVRDDDVLASAVKEAVAAGVAAFKTLMDKPRPSVQEALKAFRKALKEVEELGDVIDAHADECKYRGENWCAAVTADGTPVPLDTICKALG